MPTQRTGVAANRQLLRHYRAIALWGGGFFGGLAATLGAGPYFHYWGMAFTAIVAAGCAIGALIGYLFFEFIIVQLIGPAPSGSDGGNIISSAEAASAVGIGDGGGDSGGGDGGGGGK